MSSADHLAELQLDIDELKQIVKDNVKRKNVHEIIEAWIEKLSAEKVKLEEAMKKEEHERPKQIAVVQASKAPVDPIEKGLADAAKINWVNIVKYGWDQPDGKVKIYLTDGLDGVKALPGGAVTCDFEDAALDLKIVGLNGKNYRLWIPAL